jgi:hypothetical protein
MILTTAQYSVLNKIARRTKMDCWFLIKQRDDQDYVYDLEEGVDMTLSDGICCLMDGIDCPENLAVCELNWIEKSVLRELCNVLGIAIPQPLEVI